MKTIKISLLFFFTTMLNWPSAMALSSGSMALESRLQSVLSTYLEPTEFLIVVKEVNRKATFDALSEAALPGTPGLTADNGNDPKYQSYYDLDGRVQRAKGRPPVEIEVILHKSVPNETKSLLRRIIPSIAGLDNEYGDRLNFRAGNIDSPLRRKMDARENVRSWLEVLIENKKEVASLVFGLLTALAILILINGLMSAYKERQKRYTPNEVNPQANLANKNQTAAATGQLAKEMTDTPAPETNPNSERASKREARVPDVPHREEMYSKDSAFFEMVEEIRGQADRHPDRIAELIKRWIQEGDIGIRNASILLRNFKFSIVEKIMAKMVASDLDCLKSYLDLEFDFFSEQNERVVLEARQELMKIVASSTNQFQSKGLEILSQVESHILAELFKDEPVRSLVIASVAIPSNRMAEVLKALPSQVQNDYFIGIVQTAKVSEAEMTKLQEHLLNKLKTMNTLLLTDDQKADSIVSLMKNLTDEKHKLRVLESIWHENKFIFEKVRAKITLFEDVVSLPDRALKILVLEEDPVLIARAFSKTGADVHTRVLSLLPKANQEMFQYEITSSRGVSEEEWHTASQRLVERLEQLVFERVISSHDIRRGALLNQFQSSTTKVAA